MNEKNEDPIILSNNLLTCPFCGHLPLFKHGKIKCLNKQCKVQPKVVAWFVRGAQHSAINDWNERTTK